MEPKAGKWLALLLLPEFGDPSTFLDSRPSTTSSPSSSGPGWLEAPHPEPPNPEGHHGRTAASKCPSITGTRQTPLVLPCACSCSSFSLCYLLTRSSYLLQGRLTLLLGPPSSGKSTFLKALAGRYQVRYCQGMYWQSMCNAVTCCTVSGQKLEPLPRLTFT